jgi:plasmid stabilization system protein ParE
MRQVFIEPAAKHDLAEAIAYSDSQHEGLGSEFLDEVKNYLARISVNPRMYALFRKNARRATLSRFPFVIVYLFDDENVFVLGVMHGRRSPRAMSGRVRPGRKRA